MDGSESRAEGRGSFISASTKGPPSGSITRCWNSAAVARRSSQSARCDRPIQLDASNFFARQNSRGEALSVFSFWSFNEPIAGLQGRIPLQHPPFATLTVVAIAVGNRQFDITHNVSCSAMRTSKADDMAKLAAHLCTICDSPPKPENIANRVCKPPADKT